MMYILQRVIGMVAAKFLGVPKDEDKEADQWSKSKLDELTKKVIDGQIKPMGFRPPRFTSVQEVLADSANELALLRDMKDRCRLIGLVLETVDYGNTFRLSVVFQDIGIGRNRKKHRFNSDIGKRCSPADLVLSLNELALEIQAWQPKGD